MRMKWCVAVLPVLLASAAHAAIPSKAQLAYAAGNFIHAATIAENEGSAEALAFAARARIADAVMRSGTYCKACLTTAETIAQTAVERDPKSAEGYIQLAVALGFRGRLIPLMDAKAERLPERGREAIDKALELAPHNAWALAARGAWNLEIVHRAGPVLADVTYGAGRTEGLRYFHEALAADPGNLLLHFHFALAILALDTGEFRREAIAALEAGYKDRRADALTKFTRKRADTLMSLLKGGKSDEIEALVRKFQGYPPEP
jgi:tetratricopeptide (TPR) repeat protein